MTPEPSGVPAVPPTGSATPPAAAPPPTPVTVTIEEFQRFSLKIGVVTAAEVHPKADRLLILTVNIGEGATRQVVAGIRSSYPDPAVLVGRHVVVVTNLKPAVLRGVESQGMVLAASDGSTIVLLNPERPLPPGSPVK